LDKESKGFTLTWELVKLAIDEGAKKRDEGALISWPRGGCNVISDSDESFGKESQEAHQQPSDPAWNPTVKKGSVEEESAHVC